MFLIAQLICLFAIIVDTISYWFKEKKQILTGQIISCLLFAGQYALLGAFSGVATNLIAVIRAFVCKNKDSKYFVILFLILYIIVGIVLWDGFISLLPIIVSSIYTITMWKSGTKFIKIGALIECVLWFVYNIYYMAYIALIPIVIFFISTSISLYKLNYTKKLS